MKKQKREFNKIEDLKQLKPDEELIQKCHEIIDSLDDFTKNEKYRILTTLHDTFIENCKEEGIGFIDIAKLN